MARIFLTPIDLALNQLLRVRIENLASAPGHSVGRIYWDTTLGYARMSDGAAWQRISFLNDPYARANHTGTQLASTISDFNTQVRSNRLDQMAAPTAAVAFNGQQVTGLADGSADSHAVTLSQLNAVKRGLDLKDSVRVASTGNITLAAPGATIDGVSMVSGDRVLLKNQTAPAENGIYVWTGVASALTRAVDADTSAEVNEGMTVWVGEGSTHANSRWTLTTNDPITLGTTGLTFAQEGGGGEVGVAGAGLTKTGSTYDVGQGSGISVTADAVAVDTAVVVRKFAQSIGDGAATSYTITHNLGTQDVTVAVYDNTTPFAEMVADVEHTSANTVTVRFTTAPTANQYRVVVHG